MDAISPAVAAVERFPTLRHYLPSLHAQGRRIAERLRHFVPRPELLAEFDTLVGEVGSGLLLLEGVAGAGATTLICQLATERTCPIWLPADDMGEGLPALCAQIIALHDLPVPLVPPAAAHDALALDRLLRETAVQRATTDPLVLLVDAFPEAYAANSPPLPNSLPPGVVLVLACEPGYVPPFEAAARLRLPNAGPILIGALVATATAYNLPRPTAAALAAHSGRSFLYVRFAAGLLQSGVLRRRALPDGLQALHTTWWETLNLSAQRLARVLAAAGEPLPRAVAAAVAGIDENTVAEFAEQWGPFVDHNGEYLRLYHPATERFISSQPGTPQADIHHAFVTLGLEALEAQNNLGGERYFARQLARHIARGMALAQNRGAPHLLTRGWTHTQERRTGDLRQAASDAAWATSAAAQANDLYLLVRGAITAGTLASFGRRLAPDDAATALLNALDRGEPRDIALRRVRVLVEQLPDGRDKALVLRRLGEACFERGIKSQAMRMLAEALDLEAPGLPRSWREEREEAQVALARAAIAADAPDRALGVTVRIAHPERRGLIETEVVRYLINHGNLVRAEEVALAIGHGHTHEWAMAEVAAGHARAGRISRFREVVGTLKTPTAIAWARAEFACDAARHGDTAAVEQVALIPGDHLRNQALGLVAQALVAGNQAHSAIMAARMIGERTGRARALIDLALLKIPLAAGALSSAMDDVQALDDDRMPLMVLLATAYVGIGDLAAALHTVELLESGEERDRGRSRVAAALARAGELDTAVRIARAIPDDDERGWTLHELANGYAASGRFDRATALVASIPDDDQRARAEADLCVAKARAGRVAGALASVERITLPAEQARALAGMAPSMVARGFDARAETARDGIDDLAARSRYTLALAAAFAADGQHESAERTAHRADRLLDQVRGLILCARACVRQDAARANRLTANALQLAASLGRSEMITAITGASDILVQLGGTELLLSAAHALDEVDSWWI